VVIAHRPESLAYCERVIKLKTGVFRLSATEPGALEPTQNCSVLAI
jgi:ABC-type bacteriocin/lantibiotic exporter with double-glycine peptidase domain